MVPKPRRPLDRVRYEDSARVFPLSAASLRSYEVTAARTVQAGKARARRRPVQEGMTDRGCEPSWRPVKTKNEDVSSAYLTLTGSSREAGARLTRDLATPSATRLGQERGFVRTSSGRERAHTAAPIVAADP